MSPEFYRIIKYINKDISIYFKILSKLIHKNHDFLVYYTL